MKFDDLRKYQRLFVSKISESFKQKFMRTVAVSPTGSGKTVVITYMSFKVKENNKKVLILVHRDELINQISKTLTAFGVKHEVVKAGMQMPEGENVVVGSVQTVVNREIKDKYNYVFVDEGHHAVSSTYQKIIDKIENPRVVYFTAHPMRLDGRGMGEVADNIVVGPTIPELIALGFLVSCKVYGSKSQAKLVKDLDDVPVIGGDYQRKAIEKKLNKYNLIGDIIENYSKICPGKKAVAFCQTRDHCYELAKAFNKAGFKAEVLESKTKNRDEVNKRFETGETRVLCSVDVISEGYDIPDCEVGILARKTKSLSTFIQQVGRVLRPIEGKEFAIILDHVGNCLEHGHPEDDRSDTYSLEGKKVTKKDTEENLSIRQCPECFGIHKSTDTCPYCGHVYEVKARNMKTKKEMLQELKQEELQRIQAEKKKKRQEQGQCKTVEELAKLFIAQGQKNKYKAYARARKVFNGRKTK